MCIRDLDKLNLAKCLVLGMSKFYETTEPSKESLLTLKVAKSDKKNHLATLTNVKPKSVAHTFSRQALTLSYFSMYEL